MLKYAENLMRLIIIWKQFIKWQPSYLYKIATLKVNWNAKIINNLNPPYYNVYNNLPLPILYNPPYL